MRTAQQTLEQLSLDPEARRLAQEREDSIKLYNMSLIASRNEGERDGILKGRAQGERDGILKGRAQGERDGQSRVLLKQLGLRFGPLPDEARARLESARPEQLDTWTERVLTAATLDEVLAP